MRHFRGGLAHGVGLICCLVTSGVSAQDRAPPESARPPSAAPPGYPPYGSPQYGPGYPPPPGAYPPPGYPPPPPGYPPPGYYYGYPPPGPRPEPRPVYRAYEDGDPIPPGYRLEETTRKGPLIAGSLVLGIPYVMGVAFASSADFDNSSGWLILPVLGPWLTLATRDTCNDNTLAADNALDCVGDIYLKMLLTIDGLAQAAGAVLVVYGLASKKQRLVRDDVARIIIAPRRIGQAYGFGIYGEF